jgi:dipeptidyl aminopeptidase/acylaminoacyl peptidase
LANRGYAVLSVNFRGSTGLGKAFLNAGNGEWAGRMHDDLVDAASWGVAQNIADPSKLAIYGLSYGGYSALVGLTFTPDVFACAADMSGPVNLVTTFQTTPPYWVAFREQLKRRVGDVETEEGRTLLTSRSPLTFASRVSKPLLIGQGANDPRVKQ